MLFIISLLVAALFVWGLGKPLKKMPVLFYLLAVIITVTTSFISFDGVPDWVNRYIISLITKGSLGTAMFVIVMYTGTLKKGSKLVKPLYSIRGELSITAAFLVLSHNLTYGKIYFVMLFTRVNIMPTYQLIAAVISVIIITIMIVLTITSFKCVRRRMSAKGWKKLQRSAYVFYGLLYVHIMLINIPLARNGRLNYLINVIVYSTVFVTYFCLRIRKALLPKCSNSSMNTRLNVGSVAAFAMISGLSIMLAATGKGFKANVSSGAGNMTNGEYTFDFDEEPDQSEKETVVERETISVSVTNEVTQQDTIKVESKEAAEEESKVGTNTTSASMEMTQEATQVPTEAPSVARKFKADGTYTGTANVELYNYLMTISIKISNDKVSLASISSDNKDELNYEYIDLAVNGLKNKLKNATSTEGIDAISSATYTSNAILRAYDTAISNAMN